jgi:predicted RND superfamily exporter protein
LWLARGARGTLAVTGCLVVGVLLTAGAAALLHMRVNFLNFIALPITFGIGVDYAVNIFGRFRRDAMHAESLAASVARSGGAVALCSATTIIGYSSLLFSRNGALFSFGMLAVIGEVACLLCALLLLPAMLDGRKRV